MLKQLTLAVLSAALLPACILTTDNTSNSNSNSESATITETSGTDGTSNNTVTETSGTSNDVLTTGTSDEPTSSTTAELPTTGEPETTGTTGTTENATENTTGNSFGMCGWNTRESYYACAADGGSPGAVDPLGEEQIACADGVVEGEKCDEENGPVGGLGCCMPNGDLFYCDVQDTNTIVLQVCGA